MARTLLAAIQDLTDDEGKHRDVGEIMTMFCRLFHGFANVDKAINHSQDMTEEQLEQAGN